MEQQDSSRNDVAEKVAGVIKMELERGRIVVERKIIEEQEDEAVREKLEKFNVFIYMVKELGEKPPKSSQTELYQKYHQKVDELTIMWKYELLEFLPRFTRNELRRFIERRGVKGPEGVKRCADVAAILAAQCDPLSFNEIAKTARWRESFVVIKEGSLNKTVDRTLKSLKRIGLVVKAKYYFRLFNLDEGDSGSTRAKDNPCDEVMELLYKMMEKQEEHEIRTLKEISVIKEDIGRIWKFMEFSKRTYLAHVRRY